MTETISPKITSSLKTPSANKQNRRLSGSNSEPFGLGVMIGMVLGLVTFGASLVLSDDPSLLIGDHLSEAKEKFIQEFKGAAGQTFSWKSENGKDQYTLTATSDIGKENGNWPAQKGDFSTCAFVTYQGEVYDKREENDSFATTRQISTTIQTIVCAKVDEWNSIPVKDFESIPVLPGPRLPTPIGGFGL